MKHFDVLFLPKGSNMGQNIQRITAATSESAKSVYTTTHMDWPFPSDPPGGTVVVREINDIRIDHENKALSLLRECRNRGYTRWFIEDEEGEVEEFSSQQEQEAIRCLNTCDLMTLRAQTRGFTAAEIKRVAFQILWENHEFIMDHSDNADAHEISNAVAERFNF